MKVPVEPGLQTKIFFVHFTGQGNHLNGIQEDKAPEGGKGQIRNAFEFVDAANKITGYPVKFEFSVNK